MKSRPNEDARFDVRPWRGHPDHAAYAWTRRPRHVTGLLLLLTTLFCGCGGLSRPFPDKSLHAIPLGEPSATTGKPIDAVLLVSLVRVADPFDATTYFYRRNETTFQSDYYNGFVAAPSRLLTAATVQYLSRSGAFRAVIGGDSRADHRFVLESNVTELYGDFSPGPSPQAVVGARFFLIDRTATDFKIVFEKAYRQTEPLAAEGPDALAAAFGRAYQRILDELVADLRTLSLTESKTAAK